MNTNHFILIIALHYAALPHLSNSAALAQLPELQTECDDLLLDERGSKSFSIGKLLFIYHTPLPIDEKNAIDDFKKVIPPDQAISNALPIPRVQRMITEELGAEHQFSFKKATIMTPGQLHTNKETLMWQIQWQLFPTEGGFSGVPWTYKGIVLGNGKVVDPEISLWSSFPVHDTPQYGSYSYVRSHFKFEEILKRNPEQSNDNKFLFGEEIATLAKKRLNEFSQQNKLSSIDSSNDSATASLIEWRLHAQNIVPYDGHNVWEIEFTDASWGAEEANDNRLLTIWATPTGTLSELSLGFETYD